MNFIGDVILKGASKWYIFYETFEKILLRKKSSLEEKKLSIERLFL